MVPPPQPPSQQQHHPSQAGKFKPRKPAKKIRVGEASGAAAAAAAATAAERKETVAPSSMRRGERNSSPAHRRGKGGRGTAAPPPPQGQVFFTGTAKQQQETLPLPGTAAARIAAATASKTETTTTKGGSGTKSNAKKTSPKAAKGNSGRSATPKNDGEDRDGSALSNQQEQIVGVVDAEDADAAPEKGKSPDVVASGGAGIRKKKSAASKSSSETSPSRLQEEDHDAAEPETTTSSARGISPRRSNAMSADDGYYYDDDSSNDGRDGVGGSDGDQGGDCQGSGFWGTANSIQPIELPISRKRNERGPLALSTETAAQKPDRIGSGSDHQLQEATCPPAASVFAQRSGYDKDGEWILLQLPTRLPPVRQRHGEATDTYQASPTGPVSPSSQQQQQQQQQTDAHQVNVSPLQTDRFDNTLANAIPGRLGKLIVYKSGKVVLVLERPGGSPPVSPFPGSSTLYLRRRLCRCGIFSFLIRTSEFLICFLFITLDSNECNRTKLFIPPTSSRH